MKTIFVMISLLISLGAQAQNDPVMASMAGDWINEYVEHGRTHYGQFWIRPNGEFASERGFGVIRHQGGNRFKISGQGIDCEVDLRPISKGEVIVAGFTGSPSCVIFTGRMQRRAPDSQPRKSIGQWVRDRINSAPSATGLR